MPPPSPERARVWRSPVRTPTGVAARHARRGRHGTPDFESITRQHVRSCTAPACASCELFHARQDCTICTERLGGDLRRLWRCDVCAQRCHAHCIDEWCAHDRHDSPTCPLCAEPMAAPPRKRTRGPEPRPTTGGVAAWPLEMGAAGATDWARSSRFLDFEPAAGVAAQLLRGRAPHERAPAAAAHADRGATSEGSTGGGSGEEGAPRSPSRAAPHPPGASDSPGRGGAETPSSAEAPSSVDDDTPLCEEEPEAEQPQRVAGGGWWWCPRAV
jgi:hypothetical protein